MAARTADGRDWLRRYWPRLLFLIPLIAILCVPFYNRLEPTLGGVPFFYWYQLAWILLGAGVVLLVFTIEAKIAHAPKSSERRHHGHSRRHSVTLDLTATIVFVVAVPVRHLARLRRRALAQGRSQPAA